MTTKATENQKTEEEQEKEYEDAFAEFAGKSDEEAEENNADPLEENQEGKGEDEQPAGSDPEGEKEPEDDRVTTLEKELAALRHKYRSDQGRVSAYQRKINELETQLKKRPTEKEIENALSGEKWDEFKEEFPEAADLMEKQFGALREQIDSTVAPLRERLTEKEATDYEAQQIAVLEKPREQGGYGYDNWKEISASKEFVAWISSQPEGVRALCNSSDAADAAAVLDFYTAIHKTDVGGAEKTLERRKKNLARNVQVTGKQGGPSVTPPDDYEAAFNFFAKKKMQERSAFR